MLQKSFHIITFGCQMNIADSNWLARALRAEGFTEAPIGTATVCIVNTCSVREKPEQKVYSALGRIRHENGNPDTFSVVAGCVAQQLGRKLLDRFKEVRLVLGTDALPQAPSTILRLCAEPETRLNLTEFLPRFVERDNALENAGLPPVTHVNIMQGCDNFCAYCIVPYTRGRQKSRASEAILAECRGSIACGAKEIILLGQNVNAYGLDHGAKPRPGENPFARLLQDVATLPGLHRLRFVTPHPKDLSDEVIGLFGTLPTLCPRLHLPLQAGSDAVLARMGRKYRSDDYLTLVGKLRKAYPDIALSTDLIVGFPGETEQDFQATLKLVGNAEFMSAFSFCYSDRPGTRSEKMTDKIPDEVKSERLQRLQTQIDSQASKWLKNRLGKDTTILVEGASTRTPSPSGLENWQGKDEWGDTVNITAEKGAIAIGDIVPVTIIEAKRHSLVACTRCKESHNARQNS